MIIESINQKVDVAISADVDRTWDNQQYIRCRSLQTNNDTNQLVNIDTEY